MIGTGAEPFKSSCATGDFAAVMAIAARVYKPFDAEFAVKCLRAAERAWDWLDRYPGVMFRNPPGVSTGAYGDGNCSDGACGLRRSWPAPRAAIGTHSIFWRITPTTGNRSDRRSLLRGRMWPRWRFGLTV